jgi:hypothetical protein
MSNEILNYKALCLGFLAVIALWFFGGWVFMALIPYDFRWTVGSDEMDDLAVPVLFGIAIVSAGVGGTVAGQRAGFAPLRHSLATGAVTAIVFLVPLWGESRSLLLAKAISAIPAAAAWIYVGSAKRLRLGPMRIALNWGVVSKLFYLVAAYILYILIFVEQVKTIMDVLRTTLAFGMVGGLGDALRRFEERTVQRARDLDAERLFGQVLVSDSSPAMESRRFYLYLRAFNLTARMQIKNPERSIIPLSSFYNQPFDVEFESQLANALEEFGPLIGLGKPGEHYGAGRISSDEERWKSDLQKLATGSKLIFVIPSPTSGTLWEIGWLKETGFLCKCVFVMPPSSSPTGDIPGMWPRAVEAVNKFEIKLPPYSSKGALLSFDSQGEMCTSVEITSMSHKDLRRALSQVIAAT